MSVENPPLFYTDDEHQSDPIMHTAITLWDIYFGMAMQSQALTPAETSFGTIGEPTVPWPWIAEQAGKAADAMLAERAKREE